MKKDRIRTARLALLVALGRAENNLTLYEMDLLGVDGFERQRSQNPKDYRWKAIDLLAQMIVGDDDAPAPAPASAPAKPDPEPPKEAKPTDGLEWKTWVSTGGNTNYSARGFAPHCFWRISPILSGDSIQYDISDTDEELTDDQWPDGYFRSLGAAQRWCQAKEDARAQTQPGDPT